VFLGARLEDRVRKRIPTAPAGARRPAVVGL